MVMTPYDSPGSLINVIQPAEHDKIRRVWDRAFTAKAIQSYEPMLQGRVEQLMTNLTSRTGHPIDLGEWFGLFSMDFMGDFAFGGMFHKMADGKDVEGFHGSLFEFLMAYEMFGSVPWIRPIVQALPASKAEEMQRMAGRVAGERQKRGSQTRDLFSYLVCVLMRSRHIY
jgi:cytochrome P450